MSEIDRGSTGPALPSGYAPVNGLRMYYEIHGSGQPLVLLHGAYGTIESNFGKLIPILARSRKIIAVELQGHGRTADVDRPLSYQQLADDVAALLEHLGRERADVFGYSMGGGVALQLAMRHPDVVRKLVVASAPRSSGGVYPEVWRAIETITPESFAGSPLEAEYLKLAPDPKEWPTLVRKLVALDSKEFDWKAEDIRAIGAPTLILVGDSDIVQPEHAVELFRLFGGGVAGDLRGLPDSRLGVLPGTTHVGVMEQTDLLLAIVPAFLNAPVPGAVASTISS